MIWVSSCEVISLSHEDDDDHGEDVDDHDDDNVLDEIYKLGYHCCHYQHGQ